MARDTAYARSVTKENLMTKPIEEMSEQELIWAIEGYAASARKSFDSGNDPRQTLNRMRATGSRRKEERQNGT